MKQVDNLLKYCFSLQIVIKKSNSIIVLNAITYVDMVYMNKDYLCAYFERLGYYSISYGTSSNYTQGDKKAKVCIILDVIWIETHGLE